MRLFIFTLFLLPSLAFSSPFDLLLQQRNIADTATLTRQVTSPGVNYTGILLTHQFTGLPVLFKLGQSFMVDDNTQTLQSASDWSNVTNRPIFSSVALSGDYNDLSNRPPSGSQVNSDWAAVGGVEQILNKPPLFSGAYSALTGIPSSFTPSAHTQPYSTITGTPTTVADAGLTDAVTTAVLASYATTASVTSGLAGKFNSPTGSTSQYLRGDGSAASFPAIPAGTVTSVTAGTGLSGGVITASGTISLPNTGSPGSYNTITTDAQGRVVSGTMRSQATASRALNSPFQVSSTRDASVQYSVQTTITASIAGGQDADVFLDIASDIGFTANVQSLDVAPCSQTYTLAIALQGVQKCAAQVRGFVPAGYYARIRTVNNTGTPAFAYRIGQEVLQ